MQANAKRFTTVFYLFALVACKRSHALPAAPVPIAARSAAYVTNNGSDSIAVIDRDGDAVVTR